MATAPNSLRALADKKDEGVSKDNIFKVDPRILKVEQGFNTRFETPARRAYIDAMKRAARAGTVFPPLRVRVEDGDTIVVDGHNRRLMYLELIEEGEKIESVLCLEFKGSDADRTAHMVSTGQQGLKLSPLESGHGYRRLINWGWSAERIANFVGSSDTHVQQCITLAEADMAIQQMIVQEQVPAHIALEVIKTHGKRALQVLIDSLAKEKAKGGKKVTAKTLHGPNIPRPVLKQVVSSLDTFYSGLTDADRDQLRTVLDGNDEELEGKTVTVSAVSLKALMDARDNIQKVYAKAAKKDETRVARAVKAAENDGPTPKGASESDAEFSVDDVVASHSPSKRPASQPKRQLTPFAS